MALGGGAYAAAQTLISGTQIKNHSIPESKLTPAAISTLTGSGYSVLHSSLVPIDTNGETVATLALGAGRYVVMANTSISDPNHQDTGCQLRAPNNSVLDDAYTSTVAPGAFEESLSLLGPLTTSGGNVTVWCNSNDSGGNATAFSSRIVAIKVRSLAGS